LLQLQQGCPKLPGIGGKTGGRLWFHAQSELREGENY
jgi:hypothetical protein